MSAPRPVDPIAVDASLHLIADELSARLAAGALAPALLHVGVSDRDHGTIGMKPLDGHHPTDLLVGFTAPRPWHALGVATSGWAYRLGERADPERDRTRVHVVTLLSRSGELAHRIKTDVGAELDPAPGSDPDAPTGEQIDLLRLALGLDTPSPPCGTDVYFAIEWLSDIIGRDPSCLQSFADVAGCHPAMTLLAHDARHRDAEFTDIVASFSRVCTWTRVRRLAAESRFHAPDLVPADATWFDDGAFARFVLNRCPPLSMLRSKAGDRLPPALAAELGEVLDELGVPDAAWPDQVAHPGATPP